MIRRVTKKKAQCEHKVLCLTLNKVDNPFTLVFADASERVHISQA